MPHDPVFDFSAPVPGYEWLDETADAAAAVLRSTDQSRVIGHSDWVWQNVCVVDGAFVAGYDWDSLVYAPEPVVVGLSAGAFTQGSPVPPDAPTATEVKAFSTTTSAAGRSLRQGGVRPRPPPPGCGVTTRGASSTTSTAVTSPHRTGPSSTRSTRNPCRAIR